MKFLLTLLPILICAQSWSQSPDKYVRTIEKLRSEGKLTTKASTDKTFVGSMKAYYNNGSLVLINSLTDAEAAGTETLYYLKNGTLSKVFIMAATFGSDEWSEYYSKHESADRCLFCHGKPNCVVTEITFEDKPIILQRVNGKTKQLTQDEKTRILAEAQKTTEELKLLLKELE